MNYQAIGSGGGIKQIIEGTANFGASYGPMTDQQLNEANHATNIAEDVIFMVDARLVSHAKKLGLTEE